jgi:N utilization substance protein B
LYIYQLNFLVALKELAELQIEIGKNKFLKTNHELNPNQKFIKNQLLIKLEENSERLNFTSKYKDLKWDLHDELLVKTFQRMTAGKRYQDFMKESEVSFADDQKFIGKLFLRYVAENEDFHSRLEDKEIGWADDFHIANSMVQKTLGFMKENEESHTLIKMLKDDEDKHFASKLLTQTLNHWEDLENKLKEKLKNWDIKRIALMDKIILFAAISEMDNFPFTPSSVIINEYIEIAKVFATDKSNIFVNGILDKYSKEISRH